jgi:DNA-binding transcriptional LysR family regulator
MTWRVGPVPFAVNRSIIVDATESARAAAIAGLGLVPAPDWLVADALAAGQLTRVLAGFRPCERAESVRKRSSA